MLGYGLEPYGLTPYGGPVPVDGAGGGITVWYELWRATVDNRMVEDISDYLVDGGPSLNHDRAIRTECPFQLRDVSVVNPYTDYLAVFLNREFDDGRLATRDQLGLYTIKVPGNGTVTIERAEGTYQGHDLTAVLARQAFDEPLNIPASTAYTTAVGGILTFIAGLTRISIPPSTVVNAQPVTFPFGTTYLEACNKLLEAIGYYQLAMSPDGRLVSGPTRDIRYVEPYRIVTDDDLMGPIVSQPTDTTVANVVHVIQDNFNAPPLEAIRRNDAADSPTSTVNIGVQTRRETRSDLADQAAVDALADRLLAEGRTFYQTARFPLLPDPDVLTPHQTIDLRLTGRQAIYNGRWWVLTASMGFDPRSAGPLLEINRVTDSIRGSII